MCTFDREERRLQAALSDGGTKEGELKDFYMIYGEKDKFLLCVYGAIKKKINFH